jgi:hypothetical protein
MVVRKSLVLASMAVCLGLGLVMGAAPARAQELVPCCEAGLSPGRLCDTDEDCPGVCVGGFRDALPCTSGTADCPHACVGGFNDGAKCRTDADCLGVCRGGKRNGQPCSSSGQPSCPGGQCSDTGTCSDLGRCDEGHCTGLCERKPSKHSPSEPTSARTHEFSPPPCP